MRFAYFMALSLILYGTYGFYVSQVDLTALSESIELKSPSNFYDYRGVMNVHSSRSTGTGTPQSVIEEAKRAGLDFIVLTEVNDFPRPAHLEGYHGKLFVFVGGEYSFLDSRLLYLSLNRDQSFSSLGDMQLHLTDLLSRTKPELKDELLVLAHPLLNRYTWSGAYPPALDGIEIINLKEMYYQAWENSPVSFLWSFPVLPFNLQYAFLRLFSTPEKKLNLWEKLNSGENRVYGFAGNDSVAKAVPFQKTNVRFPTHEQSFLTVSNHLLLQSELTGNAANDREKIFRALKNGQFYMSVDLLANPTGFVAYMNQGQNIHPMGSTLPLKPGLEFRASLPQAPKYPFEIIVYKDGDRVHSTNKTELNYPIKEKGSYRIVVRVIPTFPLPDAKKWVTWIYTNPFFVK